jgi:hypothetical protein
MFGQVFAGNQFPGVSSIVDDPSIPEGLIEGLDGSISIARGQAFQAAERRACSRTARAVVRACRHEAREDAWIEYGNCLNLIDDEEREECMEEIEEAYAEDLALCEEQYDARTDVCGLLGEGPYDPEIASEDFLTPEEAAADPNLYFPLVPGTRWVYVAGDETIEVTVTDETVEILDVTCFVVNDVVSENGEVIEDTDDWYAQDEDGNVWYMGEIARNFEDGLLVDIEGSWKAGEDGGKAGVIMKASPEVGDVYRQELLLGDAEDMGEVLSITGTETVPAASCDNDCVVTRDFTPIEPGVEENKYYALGIGPILELDLEGGERVELVEFHPGSPQLARLVASSIARTRSSALSSDLQVDVRSHPSPLHFESTIRFDIALESDVMADVYNAAGRRVRSLASGWHGAGSHTLRWDGTDAGNRRVAAGMYFVRVRAGNESVTRKLIVVR